MMAQIKLSHERGEATDELSQMFLKIINGVQRKFKYEDSNDQYDCKIGAFLAMFSNWKKFNPERENANAFSYFTSVCLQGLVNSWNQLKKGKSVTMSYSALNLDMDN